MMKLKITMMTIATFERKRENLQAWEHHPKCEVRWWQHHAVCMLSYKRDQSINLNGIQREKLSGNFKAASGDANQEDRAWE